MKNITFLLTLLMSFLFFNANSQIRITKVDTNNGEITIKNFGPATNISNYRFCARFNYTASGDFTTLQVSGNLNLITNAEVVLDWDTITMGPFPSGSDLGLYLPTGGFGSGANMVDFVQWGSGGNGRESVAVGNGIWSTGDFIPVDGSAYVYTGATGAETGLTNWSTENILSVDEFGFSKQAKIFPNPANEYFNIETTNQLIDKVFVIGITGKVVMNIDNYKGNQINISHLKSGLYFIKFEIANQVGVKRLLVQ